MSRVRRAGLVGGTLPVLLSLAAACGDPSGPGGSRGLRVVAGAGITDTIQARLAQALVVEVRDPQGRPRSGVLVLLESPALGDPATGSWYPLEFGAYLRSVDESFDDPWTFFGTLADTTDERGRVSALVQLGGRAGSAVVVVRAPDLGAVDTVRFTVTAGAATGLVAAPADTAVFPAATFAVRATAVDRFGNPRQDAVTYTAGGAGIALSGATVSAAAVGRGWVIAQAGGRADTAYVSVVPEATLAATRGSGLLSFKTDGSGLATVASGGYGASVTDWSPDGSRILFDDHPFLVRVVTVATGATRTLNSDAHYARFSPDGSAIYYSRGYWYLRRQGADGALDTLAAPAALYGIYPSPSPDGSRLVYTAWEDGGYRLKILSLASGAITPLGIAGFAPSWSPTGNEIAFVSLGGDLTLASPTGTILRTLNPDGCYDHGVDWSPDGRWIVAANACTTLIDLVDTQSTMVLPLGFTSGWRAPSWKP